MNKPKKSKFLPIALLGLSLLGGKAIAQDYQEAPETTQEDFAQEHLMKEIDFNFNYELGQKTEEISSSLESYGDDPDSYYLSSFLSDSSDQSFSSYQSLLGNYQNLTENQKIVLVSILCDKLYEFDYTSFGKCPAIASFGEQTLNSIGLKAAAVTGAEHVYDILKTKEGTSIIEGYDIFSSNTKNIERVLEEYQRGSLVFQHLFFESDKFMYKLITKDGKSFLDFANYDPSLNPIKNSLINKDNSIPYVTLDAEKKDNLFYGGLELTGINFKGGMLSEDASPENKIDLFQGGFKRKFFLFDSMSIYPDVSIVFGNQDGDTANHYFITDIENLTVSTENQEGLNSSLMFSRASSETQHQESTLYYDMDLDGGVSYNFGIGDFKFEPYSLLKFSFLPENLLNTTLSPRFSEFGTGLRTSFQVSNANLSIDPHYTKRIWEDEVGADAKLESKNFNLDFGGYVTKSGYDFCPDKFGANAGLEILLKPISLKLGYKIDGTNYDGEIATSSSGSLTGKIILN